MSKVERGDRPVNRIDVLVELARQLRITLNDLMGEPVLFEDEDNNDDVPAVRDALMSPQRLSQTLFGGGMQPEYVDPEPVARVTEEAWNQYQNGSVGHVVGVLPGLLKSAQQLGRTSSAHPSYYRRGQAISARIHHLAAATLSKVGESGLSWIAAEQAMQAADRSESTRAGLSLTGRYTRSPCRGPFRRRANPGRQLLGGRITQHCSVTPRRLLLGDVANVVERDEVLHPTYLPIERQVTCSIDLGR